ncbi:hypothetical protein [Paenibacillus koleovorans]|uniref:hypothetical protein n=1 Tax=Paenibacillus koleovorans TaxID=121608 RepID=UPI000FD9996C|nr:hypothetical protein [Paenibacillus koleovorans]
MWTIKRFAVVGLAGAALLTAIGCSGAAPETKTYDNDGYLGMTNVNPSLPISPTYHTYQVDTDMMKAALASVPGISDSRIILNGSRASVKLYVPDGTSDADVARIRQEAQVELSKAVPRYTFTVKVAR